jgi:DNA repair protein RecO (recombination protein O)
MIANEPAVVINRRRLGEADRLCTLYTENLGKVQARFVGVDKPRRKMKALSEPMVWAEYRLYSSPRTEIGKVIGGALISTFPDLRGDLDSIVEGLSCCERLDAITPLRQPSPEKYRLICTALAAIEARVSPWIQTAFSLHLLELTGHSLREREQAGEDAALWRRLHETDLDALASVPWRPEAAERFLRAADDLIEEIIGRPLRSRDYAKKLRQPLEPAHA